jgi:hypothetical protein
VLRTANNHNLVMKTLDRVTPLINSDHGFQYMSHEFRWDILVAFLEDGRLENNNNRIERSIKPVMIDATLGYSQGAHASAIWRQP